jgi:serine/threonine-protein kinase
MTDVGKPGPDGESTADARSSDARRLLGQVISGRYRIDELIGEGGMGAVYRATHTHMRKRLAVKVLHPEMLGLTEAVERFEREAIAGAHIEHPNVAAASDFGTLEDGSHFLVLELLEGDDLRTVIGRGPVSPERAIKIVRQIALALRAAHQLGIVHRDLKPENIMLVQRDRDADVVKVLDFGIAKVPVNDLAATRGSRTAAALTQLGMVYGTPEYMAPEQALGEEIDGRADLYALGVMFYEMLCGYRPFDAPSRVVLLGMVATKRPPRLGKRVPGTVVPREVEDIVMRLLEKTVAARYTDADALLEDIDIAILELDYSMTPGGGRVASADRSGPYPPVAASADHSIAVGDGADARAKAGPSWSSELRAGAGDGRGSLPDDVLSTLHRRPEPSMSERAVTMMGSMARRAGSAALLTAELTAIPQRTGLPASAVVTVLGATIIGVAIGAAVVLRNDSSVSALEHEGGVPALASASASAAAGAAPSGSATAASAEPASPPRDGRASAAELQAARTSGLTALGPLAQKYPSDPDVLKALLLAHAADRGSFVAAMGVARKLFEVAPEAADDEEIRRVVLRAANGPPDAATAAFEVLSKRMGSRGPDLLYELVIATGVGKYPKARAEKLLKDDKVKKLATPALLVANDLRVAIACQRKPLLARATKHGDGRSLQYLRPLLVTNGCSAGGFFARLAGERADCYRCMGNRADLRAAIEAIERRTETKPTDAKDDERKDG